MTTLKDIAAEWDRNAISRCEQIATGQDVSHDLVLVPSILRLAGNLRRRVVLDVGCGCGFLTSKLANRAHTVLGIDISQQMIREATARHSKSNLTFKHISIEALARTTKTQYDVCLSNMAIITMPHLNKSLASLAAVTKMNGIVIFSTTHPCFWNFYRHDEDSKRFDYWRPHPVLAPFTITLDKRPLPNRTTHFHRSFSTYFASLTEAGFQLEELLEPTPPKTAPQAYVAAFPFPRFVVFKVRKIQEPR